MHMTLREPYGVVGRIIAFNHPIAMAVHGMASPLIAGNTVVLKPSDQCPLSACGWERSPAKCCHPAC
jgi:betaine-aldehyde dehydrogenase